MQDNEYKKINYKQFQQLRNTTHVCCVRVCHSSCTYEEKRMFWKSCSCNVLACTNHEVETISTYDLYSQWLETHDHIPYVLQEHIPINKMFPLCVQTYIDSNMQSEASASVRICTGNLSLVPEYNKTYVYTLKYRSNCNSDSTISYIHELLKDFIIQNLNRFLICAMYEFYVLYDIDHKNLYVLFDM